MSVLMSASPFPLFHEARMSLERYLPILLFLLIGSVPASAQSSYLSGRGASSRLPRLAPHFVENKGQWDERVRYLAQIAGLDAWVTDDGITYDFYRTIDSVSSDNDSLLSFPGRPGRSGVRKGQIVRMEFVGATGRAIAGHRAPGVYNYFVGNDSSRWVTDAGLYDEVSIDQVYTGIDASIRFDEGSIRYDMIVAPHVDPGRIRLRFTGADGIGVDEEGNLVIRTTLGEVRQQGLLAFQKMPDGDRRVDCRFRPMQDGSIGFELGSYDRSRPLVIDPVIYSTYFGGSQNCEGGYLAVDRQGNMYLSGMVRSNGYLATPGAYQENYAGGNGFPHDVVITKLDPSGTALVYSTFLGGTGEDNVYGLALDTSANVYVTGWTQSSDFPTAQAYQLLRMGGGDVFVTKLNSSGSRLIYSTYLGGTSNDIAGGITADNRGWAYIVGASASSNFPAINGYSSTNNGSFVFGDVIVARFDAFGQLLSSTFLGGAGNDVGTDIALGKDGSIYVCGYTSSWNFPHPSGFDPDLNVSGSGFATDAFVAKFDPTLRTLEYATYLGGNGDDAAFGIAVDSNDNAYVTGTTRSNDFPTSKNAFDQSLNDTANSTDLFLTKVNNRGLALLYSSYFGGKDADSGSHLVVDRNEFAYVVGTTRSNNFPVTSNGIDTTHNGSGDAIFLKVNTETGALVYSTFLGGSGFEEGRDVAIDDDNTVYLSGLTGSNDFFPITDDAFQDVGGAVNFFLTKLDVCDLTLNEAPDVQVCAGSSVGIGALPPSIGVPPYTYAWTPAEGLSATTIANPLASPKVSTTYVLRLTDAEGCIGYDTVHVTVTPMPTASAGFDASVCAGDPAPLGSPGSPSFTYSWEPVDGLDDPSSPLPIATPTATTQYILTVTSPDGCTDRDTVLVMVKERPSIEPPGEASVCLGNGTQIGAEASGGAGPYTYLWSPAEGLSRPDIATPTASPTQTTSYHVVVTDAGGCTASADVVVRIDSFTTTRIAVGGSTTFCQGESVTLDAGGTYASYLWSTGETTRTIVVGSEGDYSLSYVEQGGCRGRSDTVHITVRPRPDATIRGPKAACPGTTTLYSVQDLAGASYQWTLNGAAGVIVAGQGTATIQVQWGAVGIGKLGVSAGLDGCVDTRSLDVLVGDHLKPVIGFAGSPVLCAGGSVVLDAGEGYESYLWSTGATSRTIMVDRSGTFTVSVTASGGCSGSSDPFIVTARPPLTVALTPGGLVGMCDGLPRTISAPPGFISYVWSTGETTPQIDVTMPGFYWVTVVDSNGCVGRSDTAQAVMSTSPSPKLTTTGELTICYGDNVTVSVEGSYRDYLWSTGETTPSIMVRQVGTYWVMVTDGGGCTGMSDSLSVSVLPAPPKPSISGDGDTLVSTPAPSYQWVRNGEDIPGATEMQYVAGRPGRYAVRIIGDNGCPAVSNAVQVRGARTARLDTVSGAVGERLRLTLYVNPPVTEEEGVTGFRAWMHVVPKELFPHRVISPDADVVGETGTLSYASDGAIVIDRPATSPALFGPTLIELEVEGLVTAQPLSRIRLDSLLLFDYGDVPIAGGGLAILSGCQIGKGYGKRVRIQTVQPNPVTGEAVVTYRAPVGVEAELILRDILGRELSSRWLPVGTGEFQTIRLTVDGVPDGMYLLELRDDVEVSGAPVIIRR